MPDPGSFAASVFDHFQDPLPWVAERRRRAETVRVEGGWVFAAGRGKLSAPTSSLHRRSDCGVVRKGSYISIDIRTYATAPWLARSLADSLVGS
ncbi:MAG: hypothetical protein RH942_15090 [Kiloniellaceae bacterium]